MPDTLQVVEGLQLQSEGESITFTLDVSNYPGSSAPTGPVATVFDVSDDSDVTSTVMPAGTATVSSNIITWKPLTLLTKGTTYRVEMLFVRDGNTFEPYFNIRCPY